MTKHDYITSVELSVGVKKWNFSCGRFLFHVFFFVCLFVCVINMTDAFAYDIRRGPINNNTLTIPSGVAWYRTCQLLQMFRNTHHRTHTLMHTKHEGIFYVSGTMKMQYFSASPFARSRQRLFRFEKFLRDVTFGNYDPVNKNHDSRSSVTRFTSTCMVFYSTPINDWLMHKCKRIIKNGICCAVESFTRPVMCASFIWV